MSEQICFKATEVIHYLKEGENGFVDVGDEVLKPCLLTNGGKTCNNDNFLQYKRRWPETIDSSTHYELQCNGSEIVVVLHVEGDTDCPYPKEIIKNRLMESERPDVGVRFVSKNLKCVDRVKCLEFGSIPDAAEKAKGLLKKIYQIAEPVLKKIEEDVTNGLPCCDGGSECGASDAEGDRHPRVNVEELIAAEPRAILEREQLRPLEMKKAEVVRVEALLMQNLRIPDYQRPYKWSEQSVRTLLNDIEGVSRQPEATCYRIGTVIVLREKDAWYVVDGQQRIVTLILLSIALGFGSRFAFDDEFFKPYARTAESRRNIQRNFKLICDIVESWKQDAARMTAIAKAYTNLLEAVVIKVGEKAEAFQLFDCQNTRGRKLDPTDLLKAFHLREVPSTEQRKLAETWDRDEQEARRANGATHGELFNAYFHRIHEWLRGVRPGRFADSDIGFYKGVPKRDDYAYVRLVRQRGSEGVVTSQIDAPFYPGISFFEMVHDELGKVAEVRYAVKTGSPLMRIRSVAEDGDGSRAFRYCQSLFYAAAVFYYDRFSNLDPLALSKICAWAFMPRLDLKRVQDRSIVKYALGGDDFGNRYTNHIAMFELIRSARFHYEIADIQIELPKETADNKTIALRRKLKKVLGL